MGTANVVQISKKGGKDVIVVVNGYRFHKSVVIDMATGEMEKRRQCPVCKGKKNPHALVCSGCVENTQRPGELIAATKKAVIQFGGKIRAKGKFYFLTQEEKNEIKEVSWGWLAEHSTAEMEEFLEAMAGLFPHLADRAKAMERVLIPLYNKHRAEHEDWSLAQGLAKDWFDDHPEDVNRRAVDIADKLVCFLASKGKLIRAVAEEQKTRRQAAWKKAGEIAREYWSAFPDDNQPPKEIAKALAPSDMPIEILAKALSQEQEKMLKQTLERERQRLAALAKRSKPLGNHPRISSGKRKTKKKRGEK